MQSVGFTAGLRQNECRLPFIKSLQEGFELCCGITAIHRAINQWLSSGVNHDTEGMNPFRLFYFTTRMKFLLIFVFVVTAGLTVFSQALSETQVEKALGNSEPAHMAANDSLLLATFLKADSSERVRLLRIFNQLSKESNLYTATRSMLWKAVVLSRPPFSKPSNGFEAMQKAVSKAVESGDAYLMLQCFETYGDYCMTFSKPEAALFYFLKSAELRKEIGDDYLFIKNVIHFDKIGVLLYQMEEYKEAVYYISLSLKIPLTLPANHTSTMNTMGLCYQRMGNYDSALYWYKRSIENATALKDTVWEAIVSGNMGSLYFEKEEYEKALPLLWRDYETNFYNEPDNTANTLHRIALVYLHQRKTDSALLLARKAMHLVEAQGPDNGSYRRNVYKALSLIFRKLGNADSAFFYSDKYNHLHDSIVQSVAANRLDVVKTKLDFEEKSNSIKALIAEKKTEKTRQNLLLGCMVMLIATGWFYFRWQRQQNLNRQQDLLHQKQMAEAKANNANEKLEEFTQHLISKNELIANLQEALQQQNIQTNEELLHQTILTENDWLRFKDMFEKANPGFTTRLKQQVPEITTAELRLATLIKLNVGNKHIASMLGISTDAVRKTKSRLRQRLQITLEDGLEDYIKNMDSSLFPSK
jgi:tetratricopeptide (TPR) repeat protein